MVFANFPVANITGFVSAVAYANTITSGAFTPFLMVCIFFIFTALFYFFTKERAFAISLTITLIPSAILVALHLLDPLFLILNFFALAGALLMLGRVSQ